MSTSPGIHGPWAVRTVIVVATIVASILTSTEVVGLDPGDGTTTTVTVAPATTTVATNAPVAIPPAPSRVDSLGGRDIACSTDRGPCDGKPPTVAEAPIDVVASCIEQGAHVPTGLTAVAAAGDTVPAGTVRLRVEVEEGLAVDGDCFASEVVAILNDARSWGVPFALVDGDDFDLRLILASPATTDSLCYPARTNGVFSCRSGNRVAINLLRWESATDDYSDDLSTYRRYLINHEVGHFLGRGHVLCPGPGEPAPVMMQQTKGLGECIANGWPTASELAAGT